MFRGEWLIVVTKGQRQAEAYRTNIEEQVKRVKNGEAWRGG